MSISYGNQTWHDGKLTPHDIMSMLVSITLTLLQGHIGRQKKTNQRRIISATKQAISIELATSVGSCLHDLDFEKRLCIIA